MSFDRTKKKYIQYASRQRPCYLLPTLYLPPMAVAPPPRSGIACDEHSHTFEYSTIILECTYDLVHLTIKTVLIGSQ